MVILGAGVSSAQRSGALAPLSPAVQGWRSYSRSKRSASAWNRALGIPRAINIWAFFTSRGRNTSAAYAGHLLPCQDFALPSSAFLFALALKYNWHTLNGSSLSVRDCHFLLTAIAFRPFRGRYQHVWNHPSASPRGFALRVSGSRRWSPPKCNILEMCYRSLWCFPVSSVSV